MRFAKHRSFIDSLPEWAKPTRGSHGETCWSINEWPGKPPKTAHAMQVLLPPKSAVYAKPIHTPPKGLQRDKFGGVRMSFNRFNGSCSETLKWAISARMWDWNHLDG